MDMNAWHTPLPGVEFDYLALMGALKTYKRPRDKVTKLLRRGEIVRVKKGIYVLGPRLRQGTAVSREILGNLLYGPSYLSLDYALSWHQLIPERVETMTSVTIHKSKSFSTPLGRFTYQHVKAKYYSPGITARTLPDGRGFLIAGPEKAIADKVYFSQGLRSKTDMREYLLSDLRMDMDEITNLDTGFFLELAAMENRTSLRLLAELLEEET
jgi:hypothetical protein